MRGRELDLEAVASAAEENPTKAQGAPSVIHIMRTAYRRVFNPIKVVNSVH